MRRYILITGVALLAALACEDGISQEKTGPDGVIYVITQAYHYADIDLYKSVLTPDFVFYFNGQDKDNGYPLPASWDYTESWQATRNLFENAYSFYLQIPYVGEPAPDATDFYAANVPINLIVMTDGYHGFKCDAGWCDFYFREEEGTASYNSTPPPDPYPPRPDPGNWRLVKWRDHTGPTPTPPEHTPSGPNLVPASLGYILWYYSQLE